MPLQNTKKGKRLDRQLNLDPPYKVTLFDFSTYCHQTAKEQCKPEITLSNVLYHMFERVSKGFKHILEILHILYYFAG